MCFAWSEFLFQNANHPEYIKFSVVFMFRARMLDGCGLGWRRNTFMRKTWKCTWIFVAIVPLRMLTSMLWYDKCEMWNTLKVFLFFRGLLCVVKIITSCRSIKLDSRKFAQLVYRILNYTVAPLSLTMCTLSVFMQSTGQRDLQGDTNFLFN